MTRDFPDLRPDQLPRAVRQTLESLKSAGVEHIARVTPPQLEHAPGSTPPAAAPAAFTRNPQPAAILLPSDPSPAFLPRGSRTDATVPQIPEPVRPVSTRTAPKPIVSASLPAAKVEGREARLAALEVINQQVVACQRCDELARTRSRTVFGVGDPQTRILFLGEAPGADEDAQGEPFVGRAGQLLNQIIAACRLKREEIYICNVLKCRPPGNRTPAETECANCREYLDGQLAIIDPEYIVCWGTVAAQNLLGTKQAIGKLRRQFFRHGKARVICTYHPSYLLRNPAAKKDVWDDMKFWRAEMGVDLSGAGKQS